MDRQYKSIEDRKTAFSISLTVKTLSDFEIEAGDLNANRSQMIGALIKYFLQNKKDKRFIEEIKKMVEK